MRFIKYILYFLLFFELFYISDIEIAENFDFAQLWKLPLFVFLFAYIIFKKTNEDAPKFVQYRWLQSIEQVLNTGSLGSAVIANLMQVTKFAMFPILFGYITKRGYSRDGIQKFTLTISQYFILTCIPFLLGWLEYTQAGLEYGDLEGFTGLFGAQHPAAAILAISTTIILFHIRKNTLNQLSLIYNLILCAIAVYAIYLTMARTGWLMLTIGVVVIYMPSKLNIKQMALIICCAATLFYTYNYLYNHSDAFRYKITDTDLGTDYEKDAGSGRLIYMATSIELWSSGNATDKLFGVGLEAVMDNMYRRINNRIFSHNGFIDALAANGIVGLALMLAYIIALLVHVIKNRCSQYFRLGLIVCLQYIAYQATQGGTLFQIDLLMAAVLSLMYTDLRNNYKINENTTDK